MSVYVDDAIWPLGRMLMCHMVADTFEELLAMADRIGVQRKWLQHEGDPVKCHFDISKGKRALAVRAGAVEVDIYWMGKRQMRLRVLARVSDVVDHL